MAIPDLLEFRASPLLRLALSEDRFDVWEFFDEGPYPEHGAVKAEVEMQVAACVGSYDSPGLTAALERHDLYLRDWVPERLNAANGEAELAPSSAPEFC